MSLRSNLFNKRLTYLMLSVTASSAIFLSACNDTSPQADTEVAADLSVFEGCYTVSQDEPAQIKVSQQNYTWVMQMKEPEVKPRILANDLLILAADQTVDDCILGEGPVSGQPMPVTHEKNHLQK